MLYRALAGLCAAFAAVTTMSTESAAQIRGSELGAVTQVIDGTRITYSSRERVSH